jgi:predicted amidohydrolase
MSLYSVDSAGVIPFADTPFGRIASAICFDMDFPGYIRQAGRKSVDIMLVPAYDTKGRAGDWLVGVCAALLAWLLIRGFVLSRRRRARKPAGVRSCPSSRSRLHY